MELSKDAIRLLRWLKRHDQWRCIETLKKQYKNYEYRSFSALKEAGFIDCEVFDYDQPGIDEYGNEFFLESYRISDAGKAYLEGIPAKALPELREWIAIAISITALIVSIIALAS